MKRFLKGKIAPVLILVTGVLLLVAMSMSKGKPERSGANVTTPLVRGESFTAATETLIVHGMGTVMPALRVNVVPQVPGKIIHTSKHMENGGVFVKGELLFQIDPREYELRLASAKSVLAMQQMNFKMEEEHARIAQDEWDAYVADHPDAPEASDLTLRGPQRELAQANLAAAEASVGLAELALARTELRAPFNGRVQQKNVDVGQVVGPGSVMAILYGTDKARITVPVKKEDTEWLNLSGRSKRKKSPATVAVVFGEQTYTWLGKLVGDEASLDARSRMVNLIVEVRRPYAKRHKRPLQTGLFAEVSIKGKIINDMYRIPRTLLQDGDKVYIAVDNTLKIQQVHVMRLQGKDALIDAGLTDDDILIATRLELPVNGMAIRMQ